jgi:hypothetical protein
MAQIEIPVSWRSTVCAILKTEKDNLIEWTQDARQRYEADFTYYDHNLSPPWQTAWRYEVYAPLQDFLGLDHVLGCLVIMQRPVGETYEFFFPFHGGKTYGKILLRTHRRSIVLFSAHRPTRAILSCE